MINWYLPYAHKIETNERIRLFSYLRLVKDEAKFFQVYANSTSNKISLDLYAYHLLEATQYELWNLQRECETLKNKFIEKSKEVSQLKRQKDKNP